MPTEAAITILAISLVSLAVLTAVTLYILPPILRPVEDENHH